MLQNINDGFLKEALIDKRMYCLKKFFNYKILFVFYFLMIFSLSFSQKKNTFWIPSDTINHQRKKNLIITESVLAGSALVALNNLWYADYPRSSFHFINDNNEWKQMDKIGHLLTSYTIGKTGMQLLNWSGVSKKKQLIYGATLGFTFLTTVEIFDGFSKNWGASWGDVLANASGTGLLIGQELLWNEQRITPKYSFHQTKYATIRPNTLGSDFLEKALKDYNGQTYWLSANIWSFNKKSNFPKWLNIALGYGAEGMLYGDNNSSNALSQHPYRQFYLSFDVDLTKIRTKSNFLKTVFSVINFIKIPAPTLKINSKGSLKFYYLYF